MVAVRVSRLNVDVVADPGAIVGAGRVDAEVGAPTQAANAVDPVQVSRLAVEVVASAAARVGASRVDAEVGVPTQAANAVDPVQVSRLAVEVVAGVPTTVSTSRVDAEVGVPTQQVNAVDPVQISRLALEVLARRGSAGPISPLALASGIEVFLHNWATEGVLHSSYLTDVSISAETGAESRVGLVLKPERTMDLVWETDDLARLDRLLVMMRKLTDERVAVPLYPDVRDLNQAYLSTDDTVFVDTTRGRWSLGGRVAIVQLGFSGSYASHTFHIIADIEDDRLVFSAQLGVAVPVGAQILPMMDCEVLLEAELAYSTGCLGRMEMTVQEVAGASALNPTKTDIPVGGQSFQGVPIFIEEPDWIEEVRVGRNRQGKSYGQGRTKLVDTTAARSRQTHSMVFTGDRETMWQLVEFFDTRRGRLRSFWLVDQQQIWEVASIDPAGQFVGVAEFGDFADFQAELEGEWLGLVMEDGTVYVREVTTVQQVLTVFRCTVSPVLPASLSPADVRRVARARRTRFESDEMEERWSHAGYMATEFDFLEVLEEHEEEIL